ncbi:hypothetical protein CK489_16295 [Bradyrhizobium sp. UFLA03-84]|nr:hypothetical protein CK489_16295 [Bradyrhizobium sp. UFLA03-84]
MREVEQFLELVVNFQNDPMAVRIIGSAPLSLPLPHLNSLVRPSPVQPLLTLDSRPRTIGAVDHDVTGRGSIRTETTKRPPSGGLFRFVSSAIAERDCF